MTSDQIIAALELPAVSWVDRRVPKTLLLSNGAPTAADKRHINAGIEELTWLAALKPTTVGVARYSDDERDYSEVAVIRMRLRADASLARLTELVHRAIPYPLLAITERPDSLTLSVVHKRWSQAETGRIVLESNPVAVEARQALSPHCQALLDALSITRQPRESILALYQGWMDVLLALHAARITGEFSVPTTPERREARRHALRQCARLEVEITRLRAAASKEKQMARLVELNLKINEIEAAYAAALVRL